MKLEILNVKFYKLIGTAALVFLLLFGGYKYYRHTHPKYVPLPPRPEVTLTIIPGWNLRDVAEYLVDKKFASSTQDVYKLTGEPATFYEPDCFKDSRTSYLAKPCPSDFYSKYEPASGFAGKNAGLSLEGFLIPETYRVFADATLSDVIEKFLERDTYYSSDSSVVPPETSSLEILTMASIIEKETRHNEDRALVADILWRRVKMGWALQVDSSVHYIVDKTGEVFTTSKERQIDSPWNTYKYPGLPPGPICNPSVESIEAAINPQKNDYWYFLTGRDGKMYYAKTLEEHNANKVHL